MYAEHSKSQLWCIAERFTSDRENSIIKEIFINNRTMAAVAREQGITIDRIRQIKEKGLRRLRTGKAKRELLEKFDIVEAGASRNSMNKFNEHGFTSTVEYIALRRAELQALLSMEFSPGPSYERQKVFSGKSQALLKNPSIWCKINISVV